MNNTVRGFLQTNVTQNGVLIPPLPVSPLPRFQIFPLERSNGATRLLPPRFRKDLSLYPRPRRHWQTPLQTARRSQPGPHGPEYALKGGRSLPVGTTGGRCHLGN